jgi:hypothetical protein
MDYEEIYSKAEELNDFALGMSVYAEDRDEHQVTDAWEDVQETYHALEILMKMLPDRSAPDPNPVDESKLNYGAINKLADELSRAAGSLAIDSEFEDDRGELMKSWKEAQKAYEDVEKAMMS